MLPAGVGLAGCTIAVTVSGGPKVAARTTAPTVSWPESKTVTVAEPLAGTVTVVATVAPWPNSSTTAPGTGTSVSSVALRRRVTIRSK